IECERFVTLDVGHPTACGELARCIITEPTDGGDARSSMRVGNRAAKLGYTSCKAGGNTIPFHEDQTSSGLSAGGERDTGTSYGFGWRDEIGGASRERNHGEQRENGVSAKHRRVL